MSSNMELFNEATASILSRLYEKFPNRMGALKAEEISAGASPEELNVFGATAEFLLDEGFIVGGSPNAQGKFISNVRLTSKGLAVLKSTPTSLDKNNQAPFGETLKNVLGSGSMQAMNTIIGELLSAYIKYQTQT
ncbi:MAG: hypothetical protein KZQ80_17565 [Candidatus Thiodiazotropha sp. (ex Monitilora ramsayi)]|nr:hypothetical protein [Candidatus Thiodiazotropha sp. (ex Monitilora ramsayi)]